MSTDEILGIDEEELLVLALHNAVKYKGKANPGAIIPKLLGKDPSLKSKMKELMPLVQSVVNHVNSLSLLEQTEQLKALSPELLEKKEKPEKKGLKELEGVGEEGVVMRFAPSPSGPMHIGHAGTGGLSSLYVNKYGGRFIMRIEDTNASNIYEPAYEMIKKEANWLFGNVSEFIIQSERLPLYYSYAEKLFAHDKLFVCTCTPEAYQELTKNTPYCPCKAKPHNDHLKAWKAMLDGTTMQGGAVVRFRTPEGLNNPALRNFPVFRINEEPHPRTGTEYRVWPLMNFSVSIDDIESGMTHVIRAKEHADNAKKQHMIYEALGKQDSFPKTYFLGRVKFTDMEISCSKTKARIEQGEYTGWDDIRLPFLAPLRRRGYQPGAFMRFSQEIGLTSTDKVLTKEEYFKTLNAFNKEIIEPLAQHYFAVHDGVRVPLEGMKKELFTPPIHPDKEIAQQFSDKGLRRKLLLTNKVLIEKQDYEQLIIGECVRLKEAINVTKTAQGFNYHSTTVEEFTGNRIIHWLADDEDNVNIKVRTEKGDFEVLAEPATNSVKVGTLVQFERHGFYRKDSSDEYWFAHK